MMIWSAKSMKRATGFLRFDKVDALDEKWTILDKGDAIHLKIKIAAFPAKKQIAIDKVRQAISEIQ
jgi:Predicted exosome subunit